MRSKRDDPNKRQSKKDNDSKKPAKTGANQFAFHSSKDKMDAASSTDGFILNDDDVNDESGNSFAVSAVVPNVSSFALTVFFMSHFDIQTNEDSSEARVSGHESKVDEIECVSQDAKASLSLCPVGLA
jgi:hypothetical protein